MINKWHYLQNKLNYTKNNVEHMTIIVIEDEKKLARSLKEGLEAEGYKVAIFHDAESAEEKIMSKPHNYSLVLLDMMLPGKNGLDFCTCLRSQNITIPILALTAKGTVEDTIEALDAGVDDYMSKPFSFDELVARTRALRRRPASMHGIQISIGDVKLDSVAHEVYRGKKMVALTMKEFEVLQYLMERVGKAVSREEIFAHLWPNEDISLSNVVDVHIRNLRKKIDDPYSKKIIKTVRGIGYTVKT